MLNIDSGGSSFNAAAPGPIGGTTPAAGTFTTLVATSATLADFVAISETGASTSALQIDLRPSTANADGFYWDATHGVVLKSYGSLIASFNGNTAIGVSLGSASAGYAINSTGTPLGSPDLNWSRISAGLWGAGTGAAASFAASISCASVLLTAGAGAGRPIATGKLSINTTAVANSGAGEDILQTYDLPTDSFSAAGKGVHITAWGFTANNANAKTVKLYFGSVILTNALTISIAGVWRIEADVFSTGTDAQDYISQLVTTGTAGVALNDLEKGSLTENDGAAITIKCTGEAVDTNDIVQEGLLVTFLN